MKLNRLLETVGGGAQASIAHDNGENPEIVAVSADSRKVGPGAIFFALSGSKAEGSKFIPDAIKAGAAAVVTDRFPERSLDKLAVPLVVSDNPRLLLARIAAVFHPLQPETMAAVTGTAGKTSVASFVRQIWEACGRSAASIGTTGVVAPDRDVYGSLTTPDPVALHQLLDELAASGVTHGVMEASSHGLDQYRLHGVRLAAAGFTNLGRDHLDYHADAEEYFSAKMRLFSELLPEGKPAVVYSDDAWSDLAADVVRSHNRSLQTVGRKGDFIRLKRLELERYRQIAEIDHHGRIFRVAFPLAGDFQLANGLVAAGLAIACGEDPAAVFSAMEHLKGAPGRLELVGHKQNGAPCYVDYAHKPEALENVLSSVRPFTTGRIVCVFGCGGDRDPGKRPIMGEIASRLADSVIVTDDNPRSEDPVSIRNAILAAAPGAVEVGGRKEAIELAVAALEEGDCLIVAGKGHETGQIIGDREYHFSDHEVIRDALQKTSNERNPVGGKGMA